MDSIGLQYFFQLISSSLLAYFKTNAIMGPQLITFLILEFIVSIAIVRKSKHPDFPIPLVPTEYEERIEEMNNSKVAGQKLGEKAWAQGDPDFPIPLVPAKRTDEYANRMNNKQKMSKFTRCVTVLLYTVQVLALWFPVATLHAFAYNIVDRVEVADNISTGNICRVCALSNTTHLCPRGVESTVLLRGSTVLH